MIHSRILALAAIVVLLQCVVSTTLNARAQTDGIYGKNLVVNGDAEADAGAANSSTIVKPKAWVTSGQPDVIQYGASGGFPETNDPGPTDRGKNLFEGGNVAKSTMTQSISLAAAATDIATGVVQYTFSAYLGGFSNQDDCAMATVTFQDAHGVTIGKSVTLGPVTQVQRKTKTELLLRSATGTVPKGATNAQVTIEMIRYQGQYNDGSADDIALVLKKT
jgi:hypothetical protein